METEKKTEEKEQEQHVQSSKNSRVSKASLNLE